MAHVVLGCQVCLTTFPNVFHLKKHMYFMSHRQKIVEVFKSDMPRGKGPFPHILLIQAAAKQTQPITGLSLVTVCFTKELGSLFYLCHVCEETCSSDKIVVHLVSGNHCSNYFNYTDPNKLCYSWLPSMNMGAILKHSLIQEKQIKGPGTLQVLELPEKLMRTLITSTYSEVMNTLREYEELSRCLDAVKPKRTIIQTYQRDSDRKHPLLGLQHLVECVCDGATGKSYYLCTLCKLTLAAHMIIKHVLSFDHIFCYFKEWHPSTLLSKECYTNYQSFASKILHFSRQTEEIYGAADNEIKQMILDPAEYSSVNFACYAEALKVLESKRNENKQSSLIVSIKPGPTLESLGITKSLSYSVFLRCQDCSEIFDSIYKYLNHLPQRKHKWMLMKCFGQDKRTDFCEQKVLKPYLDFYNYLQKCSRRNEPVIGVSLIVTCITTEMKLNCIHVCFACGEALADFALVKHLESISHLVNTLLYQNPWRLPFAWTDYLNVTELKSLAWEEEMEKRSKIVTMKVFDMPHALFWSLLPSTYEEVMKNLQLHHTAMKDAVPPRETYSKLVENERFPLLGKQFLVSYDVGNENHSRKAALCLLCERIMSDDEFYSHVFSREHVARFLEHFHPGSLTPDTDAETILDLAKQAARIHSISNVQVLKLVRPIEEPYTYHQAICILQSAKQRYKAEALQPPIKPKMKLVPRETVKEMAEVKDSSETNSSDRPTTSPVPFTKDSENMTSPKSVMASSVTTSHPKAAQEDVESKNREPVIEVTQQLPHSSEPSVKSLQTLNVEPVDSTVILQAQEKEQDMTKNIQVVENESHVDSEDKLRPVLHVSSSGTNATCMLPDSTKDNIPSSTNTEPLKTATASKILGRSQSSPASTGPGAATKPSAAKRGSSMSPTSTAPASSSAKSSASTVSSTAAPITKTTSAMSDGSNHKTSHTEPVHSTMTKMKPNENPPKVGLNHLFVVSCERKQQVYCELCSVRLRHSMHVYSDTHRLNYVKMKFPDFECEQSVLKSKLDNIVAHLAEVEKNVTQRKCKNIKVKRDVYKELAALSEDKAIERVKSMLNDQALWETPSPTSDVLALTQGCIESSTSPFDITSPGEEINLLHDEGSGVSSDHQQEHETNKEIVQGSEANGLNQRQLHPQLSRNNPEPTPAPSIAKPHTAVNSEPGNERVSHEAPNVLLGKSTMGPSKLSYYLMVKNMESDAVLGMGSVWECQGISQNPFYLCENCRTTLSLNDICRHIVSSAHQTNCMKVDYHRFLYFMDWDNVPQEEKHNILKDIAQMFSAQERSKKIDAQVVILTPKGYDIVREAPFSEALEMLQVIKGSSSVSTSQQQEPEKQPEDQQSEKECPQMETEAAPTQTDQQDNEATKEPEKYHLDMAVKDGGVDDDMSIVSSDDDSTETDWIISTQPEPTQSVSQHPRPVPELEAQQVEDHSESPSFCDNHQETAQSVSPSDMCLQGSKRPAPVETHDTTDPQLEYPQQAKRACSSLEAVSQCFPESAFEFTSINVASTSTLLTPEDKHTEHITICHKLLELVNQPKQDMLVKAKAFSASSSFEINVERRVDTDYRVKTNSSSESSEGTTFVAPLPKSISVPYANNSSCGSPAAIGPAADADGATLKAASSADPCDPPVSSTLDEREPPPGWFTPLHGHQPQHMPSFTGNTQTTNTGLCPMPVNSVIAVGPDAGTTAKHGGTVAASGNHGQFSQHATDLSGYPSPQAGVGGNNNNSTWYPAWLPWASLAPPIPREWVNQQMYYYYYYHHHYYQQQQQQLVMAQQYAPSTSNTLPARNEDVTSDVTTQFSNVTNNTQF